MPRLPLSELGDSTADRVIGHRPEVLAAWDGLKHALVGPTSTLPPELKEQVRRALALHTGCEFCASLGVPAAEQPSSRDSLAVAFAEAAAMDHAAISGCQLEVLLEEFSVPQVVELLTWIVFEYAGQMFGALIGDEPATAQERAAFEAAVAGQPRAAGPIQTGGRLGTADRTHDGRRVGGCVQPDVQNCPQTQPQTQTRTDHNPRVGCSSPSSGNTVDLEHLPAYADASRPGQYGSWD